MKPYHTCDTVRYAVPALAPKVFTSAVFFVLGVLVTICFCLRACASCGWFPGLGLLLSFASAWVESFFREWYEPSTRNDSRG